MRRRLPAEALSPLGVELALRLDCGWTHIIEHAIEFDRASGFRVRVSVVSDLRCDRRRSRQGVVNELLTESCELRVRDRRRPGLLHGSYAIRPFSPSGTGDCQIMAQTHKTCSNNSNRRMSQDASSIAFRKGVRPRATIQQICCSPRRVYATGFPCKRALAFAGATPQERAGRRALRLFPPIFLEFRGAGTYGTG